LGNKLGVGGSKHFDPANEDEGCGDPNLLGEPYPEPRPCCGLLVVRAGMVMGLEWLRATDIFFGVGVVDAWW